MSRLTLCNPLGCRIPGFPVLHYLLEFAQTYVRWVGDAIQPSHPVIPFSCFQCFPISGSFPVSQLFASGGQSIGASALVLSMNTQDWFPLGLTGLISLRSKGLSRLCSSTTIWKHQFFGTQSNFFFIVFIVQLSHPYMTTGKTIALTRQTFVGKMMSLLLNMLCRFVIAFLPRSKCLLISWLQSLSAVIFGAQENKIYHCFHFFPIYLPWSVGTRCHDLSFFTLSVFFF